MAPVPPPPGKGLAPVHHAPIRTAPETGDPRQMTLHALFLILARGKWRVLGVALAAAGLAALYGLVLATPQYTARATVMLETREERIVNLDSVMSGLSGEATVVNSEAEVLRSRSLIGRVVRDLDLTADPEFNPELRPRGRLALLRDRISAALRTRGLLPAVPPPDPETAAQRSRDRTIGQVLSRTSVTVLPQSVVFEITAVSGDPAKAARLANTIAERYVLEQLEVKFEATEKATGWLSDRVADLRRELEDRQSALKAFAAETELVNADSLDALTRQQKEIRERIADGTAALVVFETRVAALAEAADSPAAFAGQADDRQLSRLWARLKVSPGDARLTESLAERQRAILAEARQDVARLKSQLAALRRSEQELTARIQQQSEDLVTLEQMEREAEASALIYEHFLNRLKETSVQQGIQQADSRVLSPATVPLAPSAPRTAMLTVLAGVLGLLIGAGWVVLRDRAQAVFRSRAELEQATGLPVMGQMPRVRGVKRGGLLRYLVTHPNSAAAEAVRNLRTSLLMAGGERAPQVIMCTSSLPGEGKTTQAVALAQNFAAMGRRVLLIEGDVRRRVFTQYFDLPAGTGVIAATTGTASLDQAVQHAPALGFDILMGDSGTANPADIFAAPRFAALIERARARYDIVLLDTPPVLMVPDARIVGRQADAILYAVQWDSTPRSAVAEGLQQLRTARLRVAGLVLTQLDPRGQQRYGYEGAYAAARAYHEG